MSGAQQLEAGVHLPARVLEELQNIVGKRWVLTQKEALETYDSDGLTMTRSLPRAVVLPESTEEVARIVRLLHRARIPFLPRGAGTGLSGGVVPLRHEVVISLARMKKLLSIDPLNRLAVVQPGFVNMRLTQVVASEGLYFAPDPSSQYTCTIGGNVGENAGGAHCLKYGVTVNHVLGMTVVLPDGDIVTIGGGVDTPGYDILALLTGAEGTLGIVTEMIVRLLPVPEAHQTALAYFDTVEAASQTVSEIIGSGIVPAALEMMDRIAIEGVEKGTKPVGHPRDVAAVLLIEVDGMKASLEGQMEKIVAIAQKHGVRSIHLARDEKERKRWWDNRKTAFAAMGAISPNYVVQDGVIPISRLPEVLQRIARISETYGLRIANVFHAGDGNLHPLILYDAAKPGEEARAHEAGLMALKVCTDVGGSITGEHGVGLEKREAMCFMFDDSVLALGRRLRQAIDKEGLINAEKIYPTPGRCGEVVQARWAVDHRNDRR